MSDKHRKHKNRDEHIADWERKRHTTLARKNMLEQTCDPNDLRQDLSVYRDLFDSAPDAIVLIDLQGNIVDVNRMALEQFGYTTEQMLGMQFTDLMTDDSIEKAASTVTAFLDGKVVSQTGRYRRSDGKIFKAETTSAIVHKGANRVAKVVLRDANKRKRAESALAREQMLLQALMQTLPEQIYFKDKQSRFIRINKAQMRTFGVTSQKQILGKTDFDFFSEEHASSAFADEQEIMRTGMSMVGKEEKETWADGRETWVSTTKAPLLDAEGNIIGTFGISRDITTVKRHETMRSQVESRMQHTDKMESLGMLASGIAHDFNNLLMGVLGNTSLALAALPEDDSVWTTVKQIETTAMRAADLTNQLLAYSGMGGVTVKTLNLNSLVKEMTKLLEITISKNVALRYNFSDSLPPIEGDATQMRQVIMNLITNASDALGDHSGTISVATGYIDCDETYLAQAYVADHLKPGRYVFLEVSDTGAGMDAETRKKIFDPFFTTKPTGRGLGLATVFGIVRGHNGALKVYSEKGKGTTFKVLFRASERATVVRKRKKQEAAAHEWKGSGKVLVVDDEDIIRQVAGQMLEALGFESFCASSGEEAIEIFGREKDIRMVLLDEVMPRMDGEQVYTELRRMDPNLKVILCSGYPEKDATARLASKGLAGFVQKPFTLKILSAKIREILEGTRS